MSWLRQNFFGSWVSGLFTLLLLYLLWKGLPPIIDWAFLEAVWRPDAKACREAEGAAREETCGCNAYGSFHGFWVSA